MRDLGYQILDILYESDRSKVYRALAPDSQQAVILKILNQDYPSPEEIARYRLEYDITRRLASDQVICVHGLDRYQNTLVMVLEDFGATSLKQLLPTLNLPLPEFLAIAIHLTETLDYIHRQGIIHKDINPSNIVMNPVTRQVKVIDFGLSTVLSQEKAVPSAPNVLEGTLAYISPEQTGRMNREVDYRTDFYSLGATLYELLTGQLPFPILDPLELVHSHIAKQPMPPHEICPAIPVSISQIVLKLLAKMPEHRYQNAAGLKFDLHHCLESFQQLGTIPTFALGEQDVSDRFTLPGKLYGREREVQVLLEACDRVGEGANELMLISGYSGIGKSALVQEIYKPLTRQRGYFIAGKFDQFQRNIPYSALIQALRSLIRQLLTSNESEITSWQDQILAVLGANAQVLIDVIPELGAVLGPQPAVVELSPPEAQNRFNLLFQSFISVFTQPMHPLVMFLDDLQWADSASLKLLQLLLSRAESQYLLLIGAYRDNEVDASHPLRTAIATLQALHIPIHELTLSPLQQAQVETFLADTFYLGTAQAIAPLAELMLEKTHGNPFFMNEFLKSLSSEGLIQFAPQQRQWHWHLEQIQAAQITDNVVDFMTHKIQKLPAAAQEGLKLAACIGNQFELQTLAIVHQQTPTKTARDLWQAVQEGFILPQGKGYKLLQIEDVTLEATLDQVNVVYSFRHDRIQQAAYLLIPEAEKQQVHWQIGQLLYQGLSIEQREEHIFDLVNHLNKGVTLIKDALQLEELAKLNLIAGKKAKASTAYDQSLNYLLTGIQCLQATGWQQHYDLMLTLHHTAVEAAALATNFEQMEQLIATTLHQGKTLLDQVPVYVVRIQSLMSRERLLEAIQQGLKLLQRFNVRLPANPGKPQIFLELINTKRVLLGKSTAQLLDLPEVTNPQVIASIQVLSSIISATYLALPNAFPLIVFKQVQLSSKFGNAPESAFAYATYGLILCGVVGDINTGYAFGEMALKLVEKFQAKALQSRTAFVVISFVHHWRDPLQDTLNPLVEAFQIGREMGDTEYAAWNAHMYVIYAYYAGKSLSELSGSASIYADTVAKFEKFPPLILIQIYRQAIANLQGHTANPCELVGEFYDFQQMLPQHVKTNYRSAIFYALANCLDLNFLFGNYAIAVEQAEQALPHLESVVSLFVTGWFTFYEALARLALAATQSQPVQQKLLSQAIANLKKLQTWAKYSPHNYVHKVALVEAEILQLQGQFEGAIAAYDRAITWAQAHQFIQEAAIANELAGKCLLAQNRPKLAQVYLQEARYLYRQWGAIAKVKHLEQQYPYLFTLETQRNDSIFTSRQPVPTHETSHPAVSLDLTTVMKACESLSREIVLEELLAKIIQIMMENAGAEIGYLLWETDGKLHIQARGTVRQQIQVWSELPEANAAQFPQSIGNYAARVKESVVLEDASRHPTFARDPYIMQHQPKSVLCVPLINQGNLAGLVYLENNLLVGAFTRDRIEVITLLAAQAAIALTNARLYRDLTRTEEKYRSIFENAIEGIFQCTPEGRYISANAALARIYGYATPAALMAEMVHHPDQLYVDPAQWAELQQRLAQETFVTQYEIQVYRYDGKPIWISKNIRALYNEMGELQGYEGFVQDITNRKQAEILQQRNLELHRLAMLDGLTQIPNRRQFDEILEQEWKRSQREQLSLSLLMCDVDFFKRYNDTYGHQAGDECLQTVAQTLQRSLKRPADVCARYGGEEFVILLPNTALDGAMHVANLIHQDLAHLHLPHTQSQYQRITLSIGIAAVIPRAERSRSDIIHQADQALYAAKSQGRNRTAIAPPPPF
ncbi:MAG: diguanylate cyclase [Leptolyngbyaceae cyanobacterium bins.349]|nr:diguanylate cyclase [Leptolyngbyaceae cyanobacterium bins.349]